MGCVYLATNTQTLAQYIGFTSKTMKARKAEHIYFSRHGKRGHFPAALRKYGQEAFFWEVLVESDDIDFLKRKEISFIAEYSPRYNMTIGGDGIVGMACSEETKQKLSAIFKGKPLSEETKQKLSAAMTGRKNGPHSEETKRKISEAHKGKPRGTFSEAWRQHLSEANVGKHHGKRSEEWCKKISESRKGKTASEETRRKMSVSRLGKKRGPYGPNGTMGEEQRCNISAGLKRFYSNKKAESREA